MANQTHIRIFRKGVKKWNQWRLAHPQIKPDLSGEDFSRLTNTEVKFANLSDTDLSYCNLDYTYMKGTRLIRARLEGTQCHNAALIEADLTKAKLLGARLSRANLYKAICVGADFSGSYLGGASFVETRVRGAIFDNCEVYGLSAWGLKGKPKSQHNLVVTPPGQLAVTADELEVAQLIYLFLSNPKIRKIIDTVVEKAVLILGRFTKERIIVLKKLRAALRDKGYVPILFDFEQPLSRNLSETVSTLAHMSRFVIADLTNPKSLPQELQKIVPSLPSLPVQPIILASQYQYAMFQDLLDYPWVLAPKKYKSIDDLLGRLEEIIAPAHAKAKELEERRRRVSQKKSAT
jgi:uncharacterized protein YjbI with pentapeptide repeats